jgi:hypothetical protein
MRRFLPVAVLVTAGCFAACAESTSTTTVSPRLPALEGASFVEGIDNQYLPFVPGSRWVYAGEDEGELEHIEVTVLVDPRAVDGIPAVVVRDVVTLDGAVAEDTFDWYAQDAAGNVWYLGEDSREIDDGEVVSTHGSWESGVDGAVAGVIMWADPMGHAGDPYYQEFYEGEAEDSAEVVRMGDTVTVAAGTFEDVLVIREWNPMEPGVVELKYYAPGVGVVLEEIEEGGEGRIELISFTSAP